MSVRVRRIRRKSDGLWLGLNMGIQDKWIKSKSCAYKFVDDQIRFEWVTKTLLKGVDFEVVEGTQRY